MSVRKASVQEFQHQIKDIRSQLFDQIKCLEQRTDVQVSILHEINDFLKKRAEIDLEYSKQLDKLVKSVMIKCKNEKQKRANWSLYSTCNLWQQLVDDTKEEAKQRCITAEVYGNHLTASITTRCAAMQKISKKCREIGVLAQGEILRVLDELQKAKKTYQICYAEYSVVNAKLQQAEVDKNKESHSTRKQKSLQKNFNKKTEKFEASRLKCNRARNEYLLCVDAANATLHKFFADDISDLIDCTDLGMEYWLNLILTNIISARKAACQIEMNSLANLGSFKDSLHPQLDKQKFFESNSSTFMLPKRFEFRYDPSETIQSIALGDGLAEELKQRHNQIRTRLNTLRAESNESWKVLSDTDQRIKNMLNVSTLLEITEHGIADHRPPAETVDAEMMKLYDFYLQNFSFFLFNANLIVRLEARADGFANALMSGGISLNENQDEDGLIGDELNNVDHDWHDQTRRKRRLGSHASAATGDSSGGGAAGVNQSQASPPRRRPRLFGGSLEEYVEISGERIPLIVTSCIRVLSQFALHHQGVFRISGSQVEINHMRDAFENGEDPLEHVQDGNDVNSIAGVLKLYLRELREPLFPFYLFDLLTDCAKCTSTAEFISQIVPLLNKLPRPTYLLLRYLFAFLNHLSEFSDENMMDPYNLAICFGPTLLPIPEGKDQVFYQNYVNEVVKNLIVHYDQIFIAKVPGPCYQKYDIIDAATTTTTDNNNDVELFMDESDDYLGIDRQSAASLNNHNNGTLSSTDFFDYRNYAEELLQNPYLLPNYSCYSRAPCNGGSASNAAGNSAMNASTYSATSGSLLGNFCEHLPPSITATLVKPSLSGDAQRSNTIIGTDTMKTDSSGKPGSVDAALARLQLNNGGGLNGSGNVKASEMVLTPSSVSSQHSAATSSATTNHQKSALKLQQSTPTGGVSATDVGIDAKRHQSLQDRARNQTCGSSTRSTSGSSNAERVRRNSSSQSTPRHQQQPLSSPSTQHRVLMQQTNQVVVLRQNSASRNNADGVGVTTTASSDGGGASPQYSQIVGKPQRIRVPLNAGQSSPVASKASAANSGKGASDLPPKNVPPAYDVLYGNAARSGLPPTGKNAIAVTTSFANNNGGALEKRNNVGGSTPTSPLSADHSSPFSGSASSSRNDFTAASSSTNSVSGGVATTSDVSRSDSAASNSTTRAPVVRGSSFASPT